MGENGITIPLSPTSSFDHNTPYTTIASSSHQKPPPSTIHHHQFTTPPSNKQRGRPQGSKNKQKSPLMLNQANKQALKPIIIEVSPDSNVIEAVIQYAHRHNVGITVLGASGLITNVTLCHAISHTPAFNVYGPFTLISLTGTYTNNAKFTTSSSVSSSSNHDPLCSFRISFSRISGQSFVGVVGGKVVAANRVTVVATTFKNPEIHKAKGNDGVK